MDSGWYTARRASRRLEHAWEGVERTRGLRAKRKNPHSSLSAGIAAVAAAVTAAPNAQQRNRDAILDDDSRGSLVSSVQMYCKISAVCRAQKGAWTAQNTKCSRLPPLLRLHQPPPPPPPPRPRCPRWATGGAATQRKPRHKEKQGDTKKAEK